MRLSDLANEYCNKFKGSIEYLKFKWQCIYALGLIVENNRRYDYLHLMTEPMIKTQLIWCYCGNRFVMPEPLMNEIISEFGCTIDRTMFMSAFWRVKFGEVKFHETLERCESQLRELGYTQELKPVWTRKDITEITIGSKHD